MTRILTLGFAIALLALGAGAAEADQQPRSRTTLQRALKLAKTVEIARASSQ